MSENEIRMILPTDQPEVISMHQDNKLILPDEFEEFSRDCRKYLGLNYDDPVSSSDLQKITDELKINPVAFLNSGNHWNLVTRYDYDLGRIHLYDPLVGLRATQCNPYVTKVWYFTEPGHIMFTAKTIYDDKYRLIEEPLDQLGAIQTDPVNCGPAVLFAARLIRSIQS